MAKGAAREGVQGRVAAREVFKKKVELTVVDSDRDLASPGS